MIEIQTRGPAITEVDISRVEHDLGVRFPDDYRSFLLEVNGGRPAASNECFPIRQSKRTLHFLFGLHMPEHLEMMDLEYRRGGWLYLPEELVPIGVDDSSELICLGVAGEQTGRVFLREKERALDEPPRHPWTRMKGYVRIADSFAEFLASLTPREP